MSMAANKVRGVRAVMPRVIGGWRASTTTPTLCLGQRVVGTGLAQDVVRLRRRRSPRPEPSPPVGRSPPTRPAPVAREIRQCGRPGRGRCCWGCGSPLRACLRTGSRARRTGPSSSPAPVPASCSDTSAEGPWQLFLGLLAAGNGLVLFAFSGPWLAPSAPVVAALPGDRDRRPRPPGGLLGRSRPLLVPAVGALLSGASGLLYGLGMVTLDPIGQLRVLWPILLVLTGFLGMLQALWYGVIER